MWRRWIAHLSIGSGVVALGVLTWGMASVPTQQRNPTVPAGRTDTPLNLPLHVIGISFTARRVENLAINNIGRDLKLFHDTRTALDTMHTAMSNLRGEPPQCPAPLCPDCGVRDGTDTGERDSRYRDAEALRWSGVGRHREGVD